MKWTENEIKYLKENYTNLKYNEIAKIIGKTTKAVSVKANNLKLYIKKDGNKIVNCKLCETKFKVIYSSLKKFCSRSCAAKYNNKNFTKETKIKRINSLKTFFEKNPREKKLKEKKYLCKICKK